ncbi:MAG: hypothetical protein GY874_14095 [Desulfobacteraceae bacterium]|nr:hypothetical protein [Desulfobacteraceae bacterium]
MKKLFLVIVSAIVLVFATGQLVMSQGTTDTSEEDASFNDAEESDDAEKLVKQVKEKYNIKLYLDFMYEQTLGDGDSSLSDAKEPSFSSNHSYLLVSATPTEKLRVGFDIQFRDYYEIEYFPIPSLSFKVGKIFLPFGDFRYHSIYGGKVYSIDNDLFPNWFTDYGIAAGHKALDTDNFSLGYDVFVSNGFRDNSDGSDVNMNTIGYSSDNNNEKAYGARLKTSFFGNYNFTASGMNDHWSDQGDASLYLWGLDFSTSAGLCNLPLLDKINMRLGYLGKYVKNDDAATSQLQDYDGFGSHLELSTKPVNWMKFIVRLGEVDPNEKVDDKMDQRNYNFQTIFYLDEYLELWTMYQRNEEKYVDEIENDYLAFKIVLNY